MRAGFGKSNGSNEMPEITVSMAAGRTDEQKVGMMRDITQALVNGHCVWEFGQMRNGNSFGKDRQYGTFTQALGLPEDAGPIRHNPNC